MAAHELATHVQRRLQRGRGGSPTGSQWRLLWRVLAVCGVLVVGVEPALASQPQFGDSLVDVIVAAFKETLRALVAPIRGFIERYGNDLVGFVVATPHPDAVFGPPSNGAWPNVYEYYWSTMVPLALSLYGLSLGLVIGLESTSHLFSSYHRGKLKKRALAGLFGILSWWWLAALSLRLMHALTGVLVPDLSSVSFFQTLSFGAMGVLGVAIALSADFVLFGLVALVYLVRHVTLYLYVLMMPLVIVFWIPGVGPFTAVSGFMKRLGRFYVPFLFMTLPVALLFRLGELLGTSVGLTMGEFGAWLTGLVLPFIAVASPIVFFWQASALFFVADRAAHRVETRRARQRLDAIHQRGRSTVRGGRNLVRGARNDSALGPDDADSQPRAHRAGSRLGSSGRRLGGAVSTRLGSSDGDDQSRANRPDDSGDDSDASSRATDFDHLRDDERTSQSADSSTSTESDDEDDPPRYLQ